MDPLQATDLLRLRMRENQDVKLMVSVAAAGHKDLYDWASAEPEQVVMLAESVIDLDDQIGEFERRLATGDLS